MLTLREKKGSPLTHLEMDSNLFDLLSLSYLANLGNPIGRVVDRKLGALGSIFSEDFSFVFLNPNITSYPLQSNQILVITDFKVDYSINITSTVALDRKNIVDCLYLKNPLPDETSYNSYSLIPVDYVDSSVDSSVTNGFLIQPDLSWCTSQNLLNTPHFLAIVNLSGAVINIKTSHQGA